MSSVRVFVVEDSEPFRRFIASTLRKKPEVEIISEVSDGLEAVQRAQELRPDLIVLDIGLPTLNGIEAARRIRKLLPDSKIVFLSQVSDADVVREALSLGAFGYVAKTHAGSDLLAAVEAVLRGNRFVSASLAGNDLNDPKDEHTADHPRGEVVPLLPPQDMWIERRHEVGFYSDDRCLLDDLTQFVGAALKAGNAAIVVATELHRDGLLPRLQAHGLEIGVAIEQGRYIALDAADVLSAFMVNGMLDPVLFLEGLDELIHKAENAAKREHPRVAVFGEVADLLWKQGNVEAAIRDEKLCNELTKRYDVDILCGYSQGSIQGGIDNHMFEKICAEHSAVHSK